jgi:hypothetical protein
MASCSPSDAGVLAHRLDLPIYRVLMNLANDSPEANSSKPKDESTAAIVESVSTKLDLQGWPLAVVIGGGQNNRTDGYPSQLWRAGFVMVNLDPCNDGRHAVGLRHVDISLRRMAASGLIVVFSKA